MYAMGLLGLAILSVVNCELFDATLMEAASGTFVGSMMSSASDGIIVGSASSNSADDIIFMGFRAPNSVPTETVLADQARELSGKVPTVDTDGTKDDAADI